MKALTKKQAALLRFIEGFIRQHGYFPTVREIAVGLRYRSSSTVHALLVKLVEKGYISKGSSETRTLKVLQGGRPDIDEIVEHCSSLERYDQDEYTPPQFLAELEGEEEAQFWEWVESLLAESARLALNMYLEE